MSHIVQIQTEVRDAAAVHAACERLQLPAPIQGKHRLFSGEITGLGVQLPGWRYVVVCDTASGQLQYDNFEGRWGSQQELAKFQQRYVIEKARIEAHKAGHSVTEQPLADGSVKLTVNVGGAA